MLQIILQHIQDIHDLWLIIHKGQHYHSECILELRMLIELIEYHIRVHITPQFNTDAHSLTAGLIAQIRDPVYFFIFDQFCNFLDKPCLIYHERKLCNNDPVLTVLHWFDICDRSDSDLAPSCAVSFLDSSCPEDFSPCREIRSFNYLKDILDRSFPVLIDLIINDLYYSAYHFFQIVRRYICRHADCNTGCSVYKEIRES